MIGATGRFRDLVAVRFGLRFEDDRLGFLESVIERRAEARGLGIERYVAELVVDEQESAALGSELTVGETYFFRNIEQFTALHHAVLPERLAAIGDQRPLRILSAGCSSGEEPFSLAMIIQSETPASNVCIRALDLNPAALQRAAIGRYGTWSMRETPPDKLERWFRPRGREVDLDPVIRQAVQFERGNLADAHCPIWDEGPYDIIFCRNVIMYFTLEVQRAVAARIARALAPGGYLFLGHAETLRGLSRDFHLVHTHGTFYYRRRETPEMESAGQLVEFAARPAGLASAPTADATWFEAIGRSSRRIEALARPDAIEFETSPVPPRVHTGVTDILELFARERFVEALALLDRLPSKAAADSDVLVLRAILLVLRGQYAAAESICRSLIGRDEHNAGANYVLGLCFEGTGATASALMHYDLAAHVDPLFAMPFLRRGLLSRRSGQSTSARADLARALDLLKAEDASRLLLFGGGFTRVALLKLCESELAAIEAAA